VVAGLYGIGRMDHLYTDRGLWVQSRQNSVYLCRRPIISLILLVIAVVLASFRQRLQSLSIFSMVVVYCAVSWLLFKNSAAIHTASRWMLESKSYKAQVLAQPNSINGELKHIEWDGWGWGGNDTTVYLVFDPKDSLAAVAKSHSSGKFPGIPCEVPSVRRMEKHWYSVVFYTDTVWNDCGLAGGK
jgi:hypothetical protein